MNNSLVCVDASLIVRFLVEPDNLPLQELFSQWYAESRSLAAPVLLFYEVSNALHRYQQHGVFSAEAADLALAAALALPITLHNAESLHVQALALARQFNLSAAYDAHYLALAGALESEFWTADRRLFNSVHPTLTWVHCIG